MQQINKDTACGAYPTASNEVAFRVKTNIWIHFFRHINISHTHHSTTQAGKSKQHYPLQSHITAEANKIVQQTEIRSDRNPPSSSLITHPLDCPPITSPSYSSHTTPLSSSSSTLLNSYLKPLLSTRENQNGQDSRPMLRPMRICAKTTIQSDHY